MFIKYRYDIKHSYGEGRNSSNQPHCKLSKVKRNQCLPHVPRKPWKSASVPTNGLNTEAQSIKYL